MDLHASLSAVFDARRDPAAVPAASVAVSVDGAEVTAAWGAGEDTPFQAASISKPVAALVALRLVARGVLSLDVDVNEYLTSWRLPDGGGPVTVRQLLCHGAALTVSGVPGYPQGEVLPRLTDILDGRPPAVTPPVRRTGPPGREWCYSGGGYVVLQQVLEDVAGPFGELATRLVLRPANMTAAGYARPPAAAAAHVAGREVGRHVYPELATAGLWCTPTDLVRLARAIQAAVAGDPDAMLPRDLAREMVTPQLPGQGLGVRLCGDGATRRFGHGGSNHGYECALIGTVPGRDSVAVMTGSSEGGPVIESLIAAVAAHLRWAPSTGDSV